MPNPTLFLLLLFAVLTVPALLVLLGTSSKNDWGINRQTVSCPRCGTTLSPEHRPSSLQAVLWGGYTCPTCRAAVDKWGRERSANFLASSMFNTLVALLFGMGFVALNLWYDYYHHIGYFLDVVIIAILLNTRGGLARTNPPSVSNRP
jgi:hypothetical protein